MKRKTHPVELFFVVLIPSVFLFGHLAGWSDPPASEPDGAVVKHIYDDSATYVEVDATPAEIRAADAATDSFRARAQASLALEDHAVIAGELHAATAELDAAYAAIFGAERGGIVFEARRDHCMAVRTRTARALAGAELDALLSDAYVLEKAP